MDAVKSKQLDFLGQEFHIGFDVHKKDWRVTIRSGHMELRTFSMNPIPEELVRHMERNYPGGKYSSVYEAGYSGYWIHRRLEKLGIHNIVVNPADVPTKQKEKTEKSDAVDSRKLSRELENGSLEGVYIPVEASQAIRSYSRLRHQIVKRNSQVKNRIKSFLHFQGIEIPEHSELSHWSGKFIAWLRGLIFEQAHDRMLMEEHLDELRYQRVRLQRVLREIRRLRQEYKTIQLLDSVTGIGCVTAFSLYAELIDISRFHNDDTLASFVGLVPSTRSTSETELSNSLTKRHAKYLRTLLIESAWRAVRQDPALTMSYQQLCRRMEKQDAIIRIAKKLLRRIRYVWKNQQPYQIGVVE